MTEMVPLVGRRERVAGEVDLRLSLQRFIEARLRDPVESEDLVQETYLRLYDYRRTRSIADVGAFCFTVARNLIRDQLRRRRSAPLHAELVDEIACPQPRADEILAYRERVEVLVQALRREVFMRQRLDGDAAAAIATDLGLSRAAVDKHVSRAVADLRHALDRRGLGMGQRP
jgi:RNA polymerase sigma factor (sigma-70 family)